MDINVRLAEGCAPQPSLLWDTIWDPVRGTGDWGLAGPGETLNRGGLAASAALKTAVLLCLFTDRACPPDHPLAKYVDGDLRGWWGDGVDVRDDAGEAAMGSLLWLLERSVATPDIARWAENLAIEALQPLIRQGAAVQVTALARINPGTARIDLAIALYARDGRRIYDHKFDGLYRQAGIL